MLIKISNGFIINSKSIDAIKISKCNDNTYIVVLYKIGSNTGTIIAHTQSESEAEQLLNKITVEVDLTTIKQEG